MKLLMLLILYNPFVKNSSARHLRRICWLAIYLLSQPASLVTLDLLSEASRIYHHPSKDLLNPASRAGFDSIHPKQVRHHEISVLGLAQRKVRGRNVMKDYDQLKMLAHHVESSAVVF